MDQWRWTLNWDQIGEYDIVVGSCPRSPQDIDRIASEAGATAILSLQSDVCLEALQVDFPQLRQQAVQLGLLYVRIPVRDFDHNDQAAMLPEAVRMLHALLSMGRRVYVHCTAGINRATLTVVGYLTFVQGMPLNDAVGLVKRERPQAHPYIDCWKTVRSRLVSTRGDEVMYKAQEFFKQRKARGEDEDGFADWVAAENLLIRESFERQLGATLSLVNGLQDCQALSLEGVYIYSESEVEALAQEIAQLQAQAQAHKVATQRALTELGMARQELAALRDFYAANLGGLSSGSEGSDGEVEGREEGMATGGGGNGSAQQQQQDGVGKGKADIAVLKTAIQEVARKATRMQQQQARFME